MKKFFYFLAPLFLLTACQPKTHYSGLDYSNMDTTARPGDNFYRYATGNWINNHPQPPIYPSWGSFEQLADDNTMILADLIQTIAAQDNEKGSIAQKIGDLYNLMMDSVRLNNEGAAPLMANLNRIYACNSREELFKLMAEEHDDMFWGIGIDADSKDSQNNIVCLHQGGLTLGNRDYYLSDDPETVKIREAAQQHCINLYKLIGLDEDSARQKMETIWAIETQIAEVSYPNEALRDPEANYHKMTVGELTETCGGFDWRTYLNHYTFDQTEEVDLGQPEPIAKGCELMMTLSLEDLKTVYEWRILMDGSNFLSDDFSDENFAFEQALYGTEEKTPRWRDAVNLVNGYMSDAVGQMFVEKYFPAEAKENILTLVHNLQTVLGQRIEAQEWMSDSTKQVALDKLNSFYIKVGYPDKWDDLSQLEIDPEKSLLDNLIAASHFYWNLNKEKRYNKPVDRDEWLMSPQTVNAYYNPSTNEICFPAGILQPPFFDFKADDATNYGAIGVVIGHEMTHGFDDQGRQFDKNGNLNQWWKEADVEAFKVPAEQLAVYFDSLWVIPNELHSNGHLCLGENIADHGGLNIAYQALQLAQEQKGKLPVENGFTPEQRFFLSYANVWAGCTTDELLRYYTITDVHSASHLRVNGGVAQCAYWYDAFDIQPGDSLYVAPEDRVIIW